MMLKSFFLLLFNFTQLHTNGKIAMNLQKADDDKKGKLNY